MSKYDNIINLKHYEPQNHPRMSIESRSAQFAPFSALTGYSSKINETARIVDKKIDVDEDMKNFIDLKLQLLDEYINDNKNITIIYFLKDKYKDGGKYTEHTGIVKKIDLIEQLIIFKDNYTIDINSIIDIKADFINILD